MKHNVLKNVWLRVAMIVAVVTTAFAGTAWADEYACYTLTPTTSNASSSSEYQSATDFVIEGITWSVTGNTSLTPWRIGGKKITGVDRSIYSKTAISQNISKIEVTHGALEGLTVHSWTVIVASNANFSTVVSTITPTFEANTTTTINRPEGVDWSNCYYKFIYNVSYSKNSNKYLEFTEAKFYTITPAITTTTTISDANIETTNIFEGTAAGSLSATVVDRNGNTVPGATVTWSGNNDAVATIDATTGAVTLVGVGTVTFTASYAGVEDEYINSSDTYTMTVTNSSLITLWSEDFSSYAQDAVPSGGTYGYACTGTTKVDTYDNMAGGTKPELLVSKNGGTFTATVPLNNISGELTLTFKSNRNYLIASVSSDVDGVEVGTSSSTQVNYEYYLYTITITGVKTWVPNITIVISNSNSSNARLDDINLTVVNPIHNDPDVATIGSAGYATYVAQHNTSVPAGMTAYTVTANNTTSITLGEIETIPAGTPVILKGAAGNYEMPIILSADPVGTNLLSVSNGHIDGGEGIYALANKGQVGFYPVASTVTIPAGKAYLQVSGSVKAFYGFEEDDATAIETIANETLNASIYNLAGQRLQKMQRGINIINGKKILK